MPESSETKQEPWIAFELVESPEDNQVKERPNNAVLTSDKNAIARDSNKKHTDSPETPFSKGITAIKNIFKPNLFKKEENPSRSNYDQKDEYRDTKHDDLAYYESVPNTFNKKYLFDTPEKIASSSHNEAAYKQEEMDVREFGGMSFNTYEWEFAPYMLKLKVDDTFP